MATPFTLRLTPREGRDDLKDLLSCLDKIGGGYLVVREHATNMHYHALAYSEKTDAATRSCITNHKSFKEAGNAVWSMKNATKSGSTEAKALAYICKGDSEHPHPRGGPPDVVARHGIMFTDENIKKYHDAYWEKSQKTKESKNVSFAQQVENYMKLNNREFTEREVARACVELTIESKTTLDEFYCVKVCKFVLAKASRAYKNAVIESIESKLKMT